MKENYILRGGNIFYSIYDLRLVKKKKKNSFIRHFGFYELILIKLHYD